MKTDQEYLDAGYEKFSAPAKINLFLKIINKRIDGYHNLQSIFQLNLNYYFSQSPITIRIKKYIK